MAWIPPPGLAHGFVILSDHAEFLYQTIGDWLSEYGHCIRRLFLALPTTGRYGKIRFDKGSAGMLLIDTGVFE